MSFTLMKKTSNLLTFIGHLPNVGFKLCKYLYVLEKHLFTRLFQTGQSIQKLKIKKKSAHKHSTNINLGSRSYSVWSQEIWARYQANNEGNLFQSRMAVTLISLLILRFNYILSTDTMVMEFIKGKWGFLTNSGMLFPGDNTLFV